MRLRRALLFVAGFATVSPTHAGVRHIVHFSDVHLNVSTTVDATKSPTLRPRYGSDTPLSLLESALTYASRVVLQPDLLLFTGDHVTHGEGFSNDYIRKVVETNVRMLETYFPTDPTTGKPRHITAITGNSDSNVSYSMDVTRPDITITNDALSVVSPVWASSLSAVDFDLFERCGYLQYDIDDKLSVLTLNTIPYSPSHFPDTSSIDDPFDQFVWLNKTLHQLRESSRVVFIAGHIPPIVDSNRTQVMWHEHYIRSYQRIVSEYRDVVKAQFFGHVHSVEFRVPLVESSLFRPMPPLFTSGAVSPKYGNNPAFTVWEYDSETYEVLDYTVYATNWSVFEPFEWKPVIQASHAYGLLSLTSPELAKLRARVDSDMSSSLVTEYFWNMKARSFNLPPCETDACRARVVCSLTWWSTQTAYADCVDTATSQPITNVFSTLPLSHLLLGMLALLVTYGVVCGVAWAVRRKLRVVNASAYAMPTESSPRKTKAKSHWVTPLDGMKRDL